MAPTARATAAVNIAGALSPRSSPITKATTASATITTVSSELKRESLLVSGVARTVAPGRAVDAAQLGALRRGHDQAAPRPGPHQAAGVEHVGAVGHPDGGLEHRVRLADGRGLPGQAGLVDEELGRVDDAEVGGHLLARLQRDEVAADQVLGRDGAVLPGTHDAGLAPDHRPQAVEGGEGLRLLDEADQRVDQDHAQDDRGVDVLTEQQRRQGGSQEDVDQRVVELEEHAPQERVAPCLRQGVGTVAGQAVDRDRLVQAAVPVAAQVGDDLLDGESVVVALRTGVEGAGVRQLVRPGSRPWGPRPRAR